MALGKTVCKVLPHIGAYIFNERLKLTPPQQKKRSDDSEISRRQ